MSKSTRIISPKKYGDNEGMIFKRMLDTSNYFYLKYEFGNDEYANILNSLTKEDEFSITHEKNIETLYSTLTDELNFDATKVPYSDIFLTYNVFKDSETLVYDDDIDAVYELYFLVSRTTASNYQTYFQDSKVLKIDRVLNFNDYLLYNIYGKNSLHATKKNIKVYECFDVQKYLSELAS